MRNLDIWIVEKAIVVVSATFSVKLNAFECDPDIRSSLHHTFPSCIIGIETVLTILVLTVHLPCANEIQ